VEFDGRSIDGIDGLHRLLTDEQVGVRAQARIIRQTELIPIEIVPQESTRRAEKG
jgi:hypothetical protein